MKQILLLKKLKKTVTWAYVISDLKNEEIVATFHEKDCKKKKKITKNKKSFRTETL